MFYLLTLIGFAVFDVVFREEELAQSTSHLVWPLQVYGHQPNND